MSANSPFVSDSGSLHRLRFVLVNDRVPRTGAYCSFCCQKIERTYVREPQTRVLYCDPQCFVEHATTLTHRTRKVS
jgi:thymidine kinase